MKRLWTRALCLFKGHERWQPLGYKGPWNFISWTTPQGNTTAMHICAKCRMFYGDIA